MKKISIFYRFQKGATIVEMLLYMAIFSILLVILSQTFFSSLDAQLESKATSSVNQNGTYILSRLANDFNQATNILIPASYGVPSTTLQLQTINDTYTYSLDSSNIFNLINAQGTNRLNDPGTTVSGLTFTRIGNPGGKSTIQVSFQITGINIKRTGKETKTFTTTLGLR